VTFWRIAQEFIPGIQFGDSVFHSSLKSSQSPKKNFDRSCWCGLGEI